MIAVAGALSTHAGDRGFLVCGHGRAIHAGRGSQG
jgi:hypothetical protein